MEESLHQKWRLKTLKIHSYYHSVVFFGALYPVARDSTFRKLFCMTEAMIFKDVGKRRSWTPWGFKYIQPTNTGIVCPIWHPISYTEIKGGCWTAFEWSTCPALEKSPPHSPPWTILLDFMGPGTTPALGKWKINRGEGPFTRNGRKREISTLEVSSGWLGIVEELEAEMWTGHSQPPSERGSRHKAHEAQGPDSLHARWDVFCFRAS